jgi:hypothetical protein
VLDPGDEEKLHAATQKAWREVLTDIKSTSPSVVASEKLSKLADYGWLAVHYIQPSTFSPGFIFCS